MDGHDLVSQGLWGARVLSDALVLGDEMAFHSPSLADILVIFPLKLSSHLLSGCFVPLASGKWVCYFPVSFIGG